MSNPENLYQRNGVWWIRYNVNGKKVRRSLETTSVREAKRLRDEILGKRATGARVRAKFGIAAAVSDGAPVPTFGEVAKRYLEYRRATSKARKRTLDLERGRVNKWLIPTFGDRRLTDISHDDVAVFLGKLRSDLGPGQIQHVYHALKRLYRYAVRRNLASLNPCDLERNETPAAPKPREERLTDEEAGRLLAPLGGTELGRMVRLALETGMRWGEVAGLAWDDLDLDTEIPTYTIHRSFTGPPKNETAGKTTEFIMPEIVAALRTWREDSTGQWLFPSPRGGLRTKMPDSQREAIFTAAKAAGITKHVVPHIFRHTFGSRVYEQTRDVKVTQRLMRHSDASVTLRIYVHDHRPLAEVVGTVAPIRVMPALKAV